VTYNFFTLSFTEQWEHLESGFLDFHFKESLVRIRITILFALFFYAGFSVLDAIIAPELVDIFWSIRFGVFCPVALWVIWYSFQPGFKKYAQPCLFMLCLIGGVCIELMIIMAGPPASYSYYAGIILIFITIFTLLRMRFLWATSCAWLIVACYEVGAIWLSDTPLTILINNNFFFISANIFCMLAGYSIELNSRKIFFSNYKLEKANNDIARINAELDKRVTERTDELLDQTEKLIAEIKERKRSEEQRQELENKLIQAHKMESIGTLAGGIAHDFNNILSSMIGFTELSLDEVKKDTVMAEYLQGIYSGEKRAKELVSQILAFARQSDEEVKPVQVSLIANEVLRFMRSSIPTTIEIRTDIKTNSLILGNETLIHQILMNLFTNAFHAMEANGGILEFTMKDIIVDESITTKHSDLSSGKYIQLKLADSGTGIDQSIIGSIFNPYFTTKKIGEGTGMGLAMVHGIVESYNGKITVESQPGKGSTFTIFLPVTTHQLPCEPYKSKDLPGGKERILFVDDEEEICKMSHIILSGLGYNVTTRLCSMEALELFRSNPDAFDLIISDMTIPKMTGDILATRLKKIRPDIPIILCTGYSNKMKQKTAEDLGINAFTLKPVMKDKLATLIRDVLDI